MGHRLVITSALGLLCSLAAAPPASAATTSTSTPPGFFVISSAVAAPGATVEFWGAQWTDDNSLGSGPASFKGFTDTVDNPTCPTLWSTDTGNSTPPPASVPSEVTVIVSSSITHVGSTISGNVVGLATIETDPGYEGNPGHPGYGTVLSVQPCSSGGGMAS